MSNSASAPAMSLEEDLLTWNDATVILWDVDDNGNVVYVGEDMHNNVGSLGFGMWQPDTGLPPSDGSQALPSYEEEHPDTQTPIQHEAYLGSSPQRVHEPQAGPHYEETVFDPNLQTHLGDLNESAAPMTDNERAAQAFADDSAAYVESLGLNYMRFQNLGSPTTQSLPEDPRLLQATSQAPFQSISDVQYAEDITNSHPQLMSQYTTTPVQAPTADDGNPNPPASRTPAFRAADLTFPTVQAAIEADAGGSQGWVMLPDTTRDASLHQDYVVQILNAIVDFSEFKDNATMAVTLKRRYADKEGIMGDEHKSKLELVGWRFLNAILDYAAEGPRYQTDAPRIRDELRRDGEGSCRQHVIDLAQALREWKTLANRAFNQRAKALCQVREIVDDIKGMMHQVECQKASNNRKKARAKLSESKEAAGAEEAQDKQMSNGTDTSMPAGTKRRHHETAEDEGGEGQANEQENKNATKRQKRTGTSRVMTTTPRASVTASRNQPSEAPAPATRDTFLRSSVGVLSPFAQPPPSQQEHGVAVSPRATPRPAHAATPLPPRPNTSRTQDLSPHESLETQGSRRRVPLADLDPLVGKYTTGEPSGPSSQSTSLVNTTNYTPQIQYLHNPRYNGYAQQQVPQVEQWRRPANEALPRAEQSSIAGQDFSAMQWQQVQNTFRNSVNDENAPPQF